MVTQEPDDTTRAVPTSILDDKYRIARVIGEGAFGRVYLATDTRLRRPVAIKELLAARNATDPEVFKRYQDRFGREARAGGAVTHPNVVTVYEMGIDRTDNTYVVMEYVDGTNLRDLLAQVGNLPTERAVAIALDIAKGLEAVHEADIVHRDLKPANIMISRRGGAKVGDFGIAQVGTESQRTQVNIGHPGTPLYMSPEQASGFGYIDGRSDLYSLGLILYEMLVGEPYARRRVPLTQAKPDLPLALVAIVDRLLARDPNQRYQSASEVVTELSRLSSAPAVGAAPFAAYPPPPQGNFSSAPPSYGGNPPGVPAGYVGGVPTAPPYTQPPGYAAQRGSSTQPLPYAPAQPPQPPYGSVGAPPPMYPPPSGGKRRALPLGWIAAGIALLALVIGGAVIGRQFTGSKTVSTGTPVSAGIIATGNAASTRVAATNIAYNPTITSVAATNAAYIPTLTSIAATNSAYIPTTTSLAATNQAFSASTTPTVGNGATAAPANVTQATGGSPGVSTPRPTVGGATSTTRATPAATAAPFPTANAAGSVKLAPGTPLPTNPLPPEVFVDANARYTLHFPSEWKQLPGDKNTDVQWQLNGVPVALLTAQDMAGQKKPSAQQIADLVNGSFSKQFTDYKLTDATQVKVAGQDGVRMLFTFTNTGAPLGGYLVAFPTDTTLLLLSGLAPRGGFDMLVPTFDAVAGSFTGGANLANSVKDPQGRFSYDYPMGWTVAKPTSNLVMSSIVSAGNVANFNVVIEDAKGGTLQQYYDGNLKTISDPQKGFKQFKKQRETTTSVDGGDAKLIVYTADVGDGILRELHQWFIVVGGKGYVLTFSVPVDKAHEYQDIGDIIADNFALS